MRIPAQLCLIILLTYFSGMSRVLASTTTTFVADALDWYSIWMAPQDTKPTPQVCEGERRHRRFTFRCDPLGVVVQGGIDANGSCSISVMRYARRRPDGVRITPGLYHDTRRMILSEETCGELPIDDGRFTMVISPRVRTGDRSLSREAKQRAAGYFKRRFDKRCIFRFPLVRRGDPFFHVYIECLGRLDAVAEFPIVNGVPASYEHWYYTRDRGGMPEGSDARRIRHELWYTDGSLPGFR